MKMFLRGLLIIVLVCGCLAGCSGGGALDNNKRNDMFLVNFDKADLQRMEKFVSRFHDGKGDYVIAIPPVIDGGYWIYDLHSDGRKMDILIDNTRDVYSSERSQSKLVCGNVELEKTTRDGDTYTTVRVSDCDQSEEGMRLFSFGRGE